MLAERAPIGRIRLSSIDPEELSDELIAIVAGNHKFCPHFHLPLQAGEDGILARMRRRYTTADYRERVDKDNCGDAGRGDRYRRNRGFSR